MKKNQNRSDSIQMKFYLKAAINFNYNFIKKETLAQVFPGKYCEISKNNFFTKHLRTTAFVLLKITRKSFSKIRISIYQKRIPSQTFP